jgi:hypothetical protein
MLKMRVERKKVTKTFGHVVRIYYLCIVNNEGAD